MAYAAYPFRVVTHDDCHCGCETLTLVGCSCDWSDVALFANIIRTCLHGLIRLHTFTAQVGGEARFQHSLRLFVYA